MNRWKNIALLAGICAIPVAAWACQSPANLPRVAVSVNGHAYPVTTRIKTYRTPNGLVRVETLSWHAPSGVGSVVSYTETGRILPAAPLSPALKGATNAMAQMRIIQTQLMQMLSRMNRVFSAAFSAPLTTPLLHGSQNLMQASVHAARAPVADRGSALLM